MVSGIGSSLSGIRAFETKLATSADNIANANSDGYKKLRADLASRTDGGVAATVTRDNAPGPQVMKEVDGLASPVEGSNVNLAEEMTELLIGARGVEANVKAIQTQDEMLGDLLDIKG